MAKKSAAAPTPRPTGAKEMICRKWLTSSSYWGTGIPRPCRLSMSIFVCCARMISDRTQTAMATLRSFIGPHMNAVSSAPTSQCTGQIISEPYLLIPPARSSTAHCSKVMLRHAWQIRSTGKRASQPGGIASQLAVLKLQRIPKVYQLVLSCCAPRQAARRVK